VLRHLLCNREIRPDLMRVSQVKLRILQLVAPGPSIPAMNHDWLDDILAVLDAGSFLGAAERRNITQSAFTRRIRGIEDTLGAPLFDRSRKPVVLLPALRAQEPALRRMAQDMRSLRGDLRAAALGSGRIVTLSCQHAITATISPGLVRHLTERGWSSVRVRSGNRDECLLHLISGVADMVVTYDHPDPALDLERAGLIERRIGRETLVPVCLPALAEGLADDLPVIGYPSDVFLGEVVERRLWAALPSGRRVIRRAETALTLAAYHYALNGIGIAWLPLSLVAGDLAAGRLVKPAAAGPDYPLDIRLIRLSDRARASTLQAWEALIDLRAAPSAMP
jgi:LysR family transcriptional regulator, hypochlorite-specific transcription factor HypT